MFYSVRIPKWFINLNKSLVWKITSTEKILYLSFDDGPHEMVTTFVLNELKRFNAKATFFCIGKNVKAHPDVYARIIDEGHAVGNHTFNHLNGWKTKSEKYVSDIKDAAQYINSKLFRPPYGKVSRAEAKELRSNFNYKIIMWHILSADFDEKISPQKCLQNVMHYVKQGSIIVFHDSLKAWPRMSFALPRMLKYFTDKGYRFETIQ